MRPLIPAVERYAPRVPDAWPTLMAVLPGLRGGALGLALYALAAITDDAPRASLVDALQRALAGRDQAAEAAAELAGRVGRGVPGLPEQLAGLLDEQISPELRHNAVLGLANLHVPAEQEMSGFVRERLAREAAGEGEPSRLAGWILGLRRTPDRASEPRPRAGSVHLTDRAAVTVRQLLDQEERPNQRLRLEVRFEGTSSPNYDLFFDHESRDGDMVTRLDTDAGPVEVAVDPASAPHTDGVVIDFLDEPGRRGFIIINQPTEPRSDP